MSAGAMLSSNLYEVTANNFFFVRASRMVSTTQGCAVLSKETVIDGETHVC